MTKFIAAGIALLGIGYCFVIALMYWNQERLIFPASTLPANYQFSFDVPFEEVSIPVDGAVLNALHFKQENPRGVVFFLHGNGGHLVDWTENVEFYQKINYDLFIFDYRGYGKSTGNISSQAQLMDDVHRAWQWLQTQYTDDQPRVIYGRSLGTGLAVQLAKEVNSDLVVLVSPFTSMVAMVRAQYPFVPSFLLRYPLRTDKVIHQIKTKLVLIHGSDDGFIPIAHSEQLHPLLSSTQAIIKVQGAGHNDIHQFQSYLDAFAKVLP